MNGDITQLTDVLNTWLPEQFNKQIPPKIEQAEQTISSAKSQIRRFVRDDVIQSQLASIKAQTTVMDHIANRLGQVESHIDTAHKTILNNLDLAILPHEHHTITFPIGDVNTGQLTGICKQYTADPAIHPGYTQIADVPCGPGSSFSIDNQPICPPQEPCPPPEPCPTTPACIYVDLYRRYCRENPDACLYLVLFGSPPLSLQDTLVASQLTCDITTENVWQRELPFCKYIKLCEKPVGDGGGFCCPPAQIQNVCPNPIINFMPPIGGNIINQPIPTQPIENQPIPPEPYVIPPYPYPILPGSIINVAMVPPSDKDKKCIPSGDMSYFCEECWDGTKIVQSFKPLIGTTPSDLIGDKNLIEWIKDKTQDIDSFVLPEIDSHEESLAMLGRD